MGLSLVPRGIVTIVEWLSRREAPPCPRCRGSVLMVEWDNVLKRWVCDVCSNQWSTD
jgi:ribosomal protein S27AE